MDLYSCTDNEQSKRYGLEVRAMELSNREYQHRFDKFNDSRTMKKPPSSGRIFSGYLVVRNLEKKSQYETWIPVDGFEESYQKIPDKVKRQNQNMTLINLELLNSLLSSEITSKEDEIKHAVKNEGYDKAAKLGHIKEGLRKAKFLANSGDCHVKNT